MEEYKIGKWYIIIYDNRLVSIFSTETNEQYESYISELQRKKLIEDLQSGNEEIIEWWIQFMKPEYVYP